MQSKDYQKLRNCPFCGGEAEIIDDAMGTISRCRCCGAENGNGVYGAGGHELAVKDWNKRPIESKMKRDNVKLMTTNKLLKKRVTRLEEALEVILDATKDEKPCITAIKVVAYMALKEKEL